MPVRRPERYGAEHRALKKYGTAYAYGKPCARCGEPMLPGQRISPDHNDDGPGYRGFSHEKCNLSAGGRLGNARKRKATNMLDTCALAVEVAWNRSHTSIGAAGDLDDGNKLVELVDYLPGVKGVVGAVKALGETRKVIVVVIDPRSPASNLRREFAAEGIPIFTTKTWAERGGVFGVLEPDHADVATAHGDFMDLLSGGGLKHDGSDLLTKAMRFVTARPLAGQTALDRRGDVDASPANAVTLALWAWLNRPAELSPFFVR